jgi:NodT family efflux transporter outer membrane factor (OMF) lipoprotein
MRSALFLAGDPVMQGHIHHKNAAVTRCRPYRALLLSLAFLVCGCTSPAEYIHNGFKVGPNYAKPPAPVEEKWIDTGKERLDSRTPTNLEWWTVLNDPVLNNLVKRAYRENLTLRQAGYRVLQFQAQRAIAAGNLFPQSQQATGSYTANSISVATGSFNNLVGSGFFAPTRFFNTWDGGFNLAWELDFWGRLRRNLESADASLDASIEDYDNALVTLIGNVASTYVNIRTFQTRIKLANDNLKLQTETFKIVDAQFKAGAKNKVDVDQALTNLAQVEALIPQLEINQRQAENQLCILLGIPPQDLQALIGTASIPTASPDIVVGIPAELLRRRPDVLSAERQAAAQSAQIGVAQAQLYPIVSITGTISWQASHFQDLFNSRAMQGSVGPSFQWNILNYGRLINGVRVQDALFQQLVANYQNVVLKAESEVENGIISFLNSHQVVKSLAKGVIASAEGVELGTIQYKEGKIQFITLANLQQNLVTQQDQLATAYGNLVLGLIQTYQALGGGWQIRLQDDAQVPVETVTPPKQVPDIDPKNLPLSSVPAANQVVPAALSAAPGGPPRELPLARIDIDNVR